MLLVLREQILMKILSLLGYHASLDLLIRVLLNNLGIRLSLRRLKVFVIHRLVLILALTLHLLLDILRLVISYVLSILVAMSNGLYHLWP